MILVVTLILFYFLTPAFLIYLSQISKTVNKIGVIVLAYAIGLLVRNINLFPTPSAAYKALLTSNLSLPHADMVKYLAEGKITPGDMTLNQIASTQDLIMSIAIPIALPLLLFSLDIRRWIKLAKEALLSLILGIASVFIILIAGFFLFKGHIHESWKVAGMLCGVYTGATANMAAIGTALEVNPNTFVLANTYDMVLGAVFLLFLLTKAQTLFNKVLPKFHENHQHINIDKVIADSEGIDNYKGIFKRESIVSLGKALGLSILILGISFAISLMVPKSAQTVTIILSITTLGLLLGTLKSISSIDKTFQLGMYFIFVFSLVVSSMADLRSMFQIDFLNLFLYVLFAVVGSMLVHILLSYIFKVDSDTTIITITALTFSPPFVPGVAAALKNKEVIITGITSGILGIAFGNYMGVGIAYFLKGFL